MRGVACGACLFVLSVVISPAAASERPTLVSPRVASGVARVEARCPTFNWTSVPQARSYELVVYRIETDTGQDGTATTDLAIRVVLPGSANGWTPSLEQCLAPGGSYAWSILAVGADEEAQWSAPSLFEVTAGPNRLEYEQALQVVQAYLDAHSGQTPRSHEASWSVDGTGNVHAASFTGDGANLTNVSAITAAVLAVDGSNCPAGQSPLGVSPTGAAQSCFDVADQGELDAHAVSADHDDRYVNLSGMQTKTDELQINGLLDADQGISVGSDAGLAGIYFDGDGSADAESDAEIALIVDDERLEIIEPDDTVNAPQHAQAGRHWVTFKEGSVRSGDTGDKAIVLSLENDEVEIRSDTRARSGELDGAAVFTAGNGVKEALFIEDRHVSTESSGLALGPDQASIWSPADDGVLLSIIEEDDTTLVAFIDATGAYNDASDRRFKRDIREVSSQEMLAKVLELQVMRYKFDFGEENERKGGAYLEKDHIGLIAQDVAPIFPEAVSEVDDRMYISYRNMIGVLVEAIKELDARIEVLEAR